MKINWFNSEKYFFTDESVERQTTDSISENLTDSDLESETLNNHKELVSRDLYNKIKKLKYLMEDFAADAGDLKIFYKWH